MTTDYVTNNLNQYTSVGITSLGYDLDGNLIAENSGGVLKAYSYDSLNRLVSVTSGGDQWQYEYDAIGNRVATTHNGDKVEFSFDPFGLVDLASKYDVTSGRTTNYVHGLGLTAVVDQATDIRFYEYDGLGSVVGLSNPDGASTIAGGYLPFGNTHGISNVVDASFGFLGLYGVSEDGSGQTYMRTLLFAAVRAFDSSDPLGIVGDVNLYRYAENEPINRIDPLGLSSIAFVNNWQAFTENLLQTTFDELSAHLPPVASELAGVALSTEDIFPVVHIKMICEDLIH